MTPTDDATFIALWNAGLEIAAVARRLGLKATAALEPTPQHAVAGAHQSRGGARAAGQSDG